MGGLLLLLWGALLVAASVSGQAQAGYEVVQLTEYCRHGARTAYVFFPNASTVKQLGQGTLTANGQRMHYMLGRQLRKNYPGLFANASRPLTNYDVELFASSVPRTQLSAISQLMGIFPFGLGDNVTSSDPKSWTPTFEGFNQTMEGEQALPLGYKPYPLNIATVYEDFLFLPSEGKYACPNGAKLDDASRFKAYKKFDYVVGDLGEILEKRGFSCQEMYLQSTWDIGTIGAFASELKCYVNYYGKPPEKIGETLWKRMEPFQDFKFFMDYLNDDVVSYKSEIAAKEILKGMELFVNGHPSRRKFRFFSGHDTGLYPFTIRFNLTDLQCALDMVQGRIPTRRCEKAPPFAATYLFELSTKNEKYYVRVLYLNKPFKVCDVNDDEFYCEFQEFRKAFTKLLFPKSSRFADICGNKEYLNALKTEAIIRTEEESKNKILQTGIISLLILIFLVIWRLFVIKSEIDQEDDNKITEKDEHSVIPHDEETKQFNEVKKE